MPSPASINSLGLLLAPLLAPLLGGAMTPALADVATYRIDPEHTYPSLEFDHMGLSVWRGKFNHTTGELRLDLAAHSGRVNVVVDTASIDFGLDSMNAYAVQPDWLNVPKFPVMAYTGALVFEGDRAVAVDGELTLRGVTRPLRLVINSFVCMVHPYFKKDVCGTDAEGVLNRTDFGMSQFAEGEAGKVRFHIQAEAIREG